MPDTMRLVEKDTVWSGCLSWLKTKSFAGRLYASPAVAEDPVLVQAPVPGPALVSVATLSVTTPGIGHALARGAASLPAAVSFGKDEGTEGLNQEPSQEEPEFLAPLAAELPPTGHSATFSPLARLSFTGHSIPW
jgi:hypothetical protein